MVSSRTEMTDMPLFCYRAVKHPILFDDFRSSSSICGVVETVGYLNGLVYLFQCLRLKPEYFKLFGVFKKSDSVGNPKKRMFGLSPTTMRYMWVTANLEKLFGRLDGMNVLEIGGGYGGQCKIIHDVFNPKSYTILDLVSVAMLADKFLRVFGIKAEFSSGKKEYDLFISNYAFSELSGSVQRAYLDDVKKCKRGYMLCNFDTHTWDDGQMTEEDILREIDGSFVYADKSLTGLDRSCNVKLIVWGVRHLEVNVV